MELGTGRERQRSQLDFGRKKMETGQRQRPTGLRGRMYGIGAMDCHRPPTDFMWDVPSAPVGPRGTRDFLRSQAGEAGTRRGPKASGGCHWM